jgi:hypothetical protein
MNELIGVEVKEGVVSVVEVIIDENSAQTAKDAAEEAKASLKGKLDKGGYNGTAKTLDDKINSLKFPDEFLTIGTINKSGNTVSTNALEWKWRIDQIEYENLDNFSTVIVAASINHNRIDIIVATKLGTFVKIQGVESIDSAQEPLTPKGTLRLTFISVFGEDVSEPENGLLNGPYVTKAQSMSTSVTETGVVSTFNIKGNGYTVLSFDNAATEFHTLTVTDPMWLYPGRPFFIKNNQPTNLTVKHNGTGSGTYKFLFPNEHDFILNPKEIIEFKLRLTSSNSGFYEYIGAIHDSSAKQDISNQVEIGNNQPAQSSWHGKTVIFTSSCTITIPSILIDSYIFNGITLSGVTITWAITAPHTWLFGAPSITPEKQIFTLTKRNSTNSILLLG